MPILRIGLAWDGQFLWHSEYGDSARIYKLDPQNGQVISSFVPPKKLILGITWVEGYLYGINIEWNLGGGTIYRFDPSTGIVLDSSFWEIPHPLGLDWDGNNFWNVSGTSIYRASNDITSVDFKNSNILSDYFLYQNYPNPFNPFTKIKFEIPGQARNDNMLITLKVYDVLGNEITTLINEEKPAGEYEVEFNSIGLPSGIYFYKLQAASPSTGSGQVFVETKKMVLLK
ncbi:MAG: T9SS type A sorting domain-containing protein [Ignavibacteriaceae bacterium]